MRHHLFTWSLGLMLGLWLTTSARRDSAPAAGAAPAGSALLSQRLDWDGEAVNVTVNSDGTVTVQNGAGEPLRVSLPWLDFAPGLSPRRPSRHRGWRGYALSAH